MREALHGVEHAETSSRARSSWKHAAGPACCLLLALAVGSSGRAQTFSFQTYGRPDGLTDLGIGSVVPAADGGLWVGTQNGLFSFDGSHFTRVPSVSPGESPFISATWLDRRERLWFIDSESIYFREGTRTQKVSRRDLNFGYSTPPAIVSMAGTPDEVYFTGGGKLRRAFSIDKGASWTVEEVFAAAQKAAEPALADIHGLVVRGGNELWMGCGAGVCQLADGRLRVWGEKDGVARGLWSELFVDHAGKLWIRGSNQILSLTPGALVFRRDEGGLAPHALDAGTGMFVEEPGGRLVTGIANGIGVHDERGWHAITTSNGLPAEIVSALCVDRDGTLWMALTGLGLVRRLGSVNWQGWTSRDGLSSNNIWALTRDADGTLWAGSESNLDMLSPGSDRFVPAGASGKKPSTHVLSVLAAGDGRIWFSTGSGDLVAYDPHRHRSRIVTHLKGIYHLFSDRNGRIWICSGEGVRWIDPAKDDGREEVIRAGPVEGGQIFDGAEDPSGALWFVGNRAIFRLFRDQWSRVPLPPDVRIATFGQLAVAPDGTLWITPVGRGAEHLRYEGGRLVRIAEPPPMPIASQDVVMLHVDSRGWVWAGTDSGIDVFNGQRWIHITRQDGLVWDDIDTNAFFCDRDGSVWIGTSGGIAHVIHPEDLFRSEPLEVILSQPKLGAEAVRSDGSGVFPWHNLPLTLRLSVSDSSRVNSVEYRYRLASLESDWTRTAEPLVRYPSLPPGTYRFEAFAVDVDRGTRTPEASLDFRILAPWWQRWWFDALVLLAGLGVVVLLWRWRHRVLLQRHQRLEILVGERTRELAELAVRDSLTGLLNRAAIFELLEKEIERAHRGDGLLGIVLADLDHFKEVNDQYGHPAGDAVLAAFAQRVQGFLRNYDGFGRYGGEEFLILIPGIEAAALQERVDSIREAIASSPLVVRGSSPIRITCSFGIAMLSEADRTSGTPIERADAALYHAKGAGRNRLSCWEDIQPLHTG